MKRLRNNNFLKSIAKFSISSWVNLIINILAVVITTRIFTPEIFGALNLYNTATNVLVGISCLGLDSAAIRYFNEPPAGWTKEQIIARCMRITITVLLVITTIGLVFFVNDISLMLFNKVSVYLVTLLSVNALSMMILNNYFSMYYRMSNDARHFTIQQILVAFFSRLFVICAALFSPTIDVVLTFNTIGLFFLMVVYFIIQRKKILPETFHQGSKGFGEVFKFGIYGWPLSIVLNINTFMIPFIISMNLDSYHLGIYASAGFFVAAFGVVQGGFRTFWGGFMYAHYKDEQQKIIKTHNYVIMGIIVLLSLFILFQHVAYMFIGESYHDSRVFFTLVLLDPLLLLLEQTTCYGMSIAKKNYESTIIFILTVGLNIVMLYLFTLKWGVIGAASASAISATFRIIASTWRGQKYYVSIEKLWKTSIGIVCIISLAISNSILSDNYLYECAVVLGIVIISVIVFRNDLKVCVQSHA